MKTPLVSIITPVYNAASTISETVNSVLAQTIPEWELLLIDDCSTDSSRQQLEREGTFGDPRIKWIQRRWNAGAAVTRNRGIQTAKGRYIAFLDADDLWHPEKLGHQINFMRELNAAFSYTAYERFSANGPIDIVPAPPKLSYNDMLKRCYIGCLTVMYDSHMLGKVYMPNIAKRQDYGLWLKILRMTPVAFGLDEVLARYRCDSPSALSGKKLNAARFNWRLLREHEKLALGPAAYYFTNYAVRAGLRRAGFRLRQALRRG